MNQRHCKEAIVRRLQLANTQYKFWVALKEADKDILEFIYDDETFDSASRLDVYRATARSVHVSVLSSIYPVCLKILGNDYFKLIAKKYFIAYPSSNPDLNNYGEHFANYLAELASQRDELSEYLYLSDLAKLEWCLHAAYYSKDNDPLDIEQFQNQCAQLGGEIRFDLAYGIELLKSEYPITTIWQQHQDDVELVQVKAIEQSELICVYRENYQAVYKLLDEGTYKLMNMINKGLTLFEIAELFESGEELNVALAFCVNKQWLRI